MHLGWVPTFGITDPKGYILPVITLVTGGTVTVQRLTRTTMLEAIRQDYIRTARAKGLPEKTVINRHAFRNTLIPLVSYMSYLIPSLFSGSMITETLYQIPGIGYIAYDAMIAGDLPFTVLYSMFGLILTQISLMLADIMYAVVDPRVRVN
jgi:peptide/nickel transport system permease protein